MKNIFSHYLFKALCWSVIGFFVVATTASAQQDDDEGDVLTPNMTVNIKLNSALSDKETAFYSKIAQNIISRIPRELTLDEQLSQLKEINRNHEHVNIVSYLPATEDVPTDKLIQHFKVKFLFSDEEGAQTQEEATIEAKTVGVKDPLPVEEAAEDRPKPPAAPMPEPAQQTQDQQTPLEQRPSEQTPPEEKPQDSTSEPATAKSQNKLSPLQLDFSLDETDLSLKKRQALMRLVKNIRTRRQPPEAYTFVVRSYGGPSGENTWLAEERLRSVTALLRQQDINLARANVTEIFVHTDKNQFVEIMPIN